MAFITNDPPQSKLTLLGGERPIAASMGRKHISLRIQDPGACDKKGQALEQREAEKQLNHNLL